LTILTAFCTLSVFADDKLAIINDPDGFTNVRSGQGNDFSIVTTIEKDEFFYCDLTTNQEWVKIIALKWKDSRQVEGYIHNSRIQLVEKLDIYIQKELLTQILDKQKSLASNFQKAHKSKDSLSYKTTIRDLELYSEIKYSPILDILPQYFCSTNDTIILQRFYATMWADKGSANEMSSIAIGDCFACQPDLVIGQLIQLTNEEQKKLIFDQIEWGLLNKFDIDENSKSNNKEFNKLKSRLDKEREK
jgi:hypothetical protein